MPRRSFPIIPGSPPERLRPPPDLGPEARELFIDIVTDCRPEHFRSTDSPLIVTYCHAILSSQQAWANLQSEAGWSTANLRSGSPSGPRPSR